MSQIVFLHGACSSVKSTLAKALMAESDKGFMHLSIDHFRDSGAINKENYADWSKIRLQFFDGFHRSLAGFADTGMGLIVEHILDDPTWHDELRSKFKKHQVTFVGVYVDVDELSKRENARGDRPIGSAQRDAATIHIGKSYDLELDGTLPPKENAQAIFRLLDGSLKTSKFFGS